MHFIFMLLAAVTENFVVAAPTKKRAKKFKLFGISGSGPEFGNLNFPGTKGKDHVWQTFSTMDTFINASLNIFRISIMMERVIPNKLTNSLDSASLKGLDDTVKYITLKKVG